ncbi:MAG TPA: energy transducer TonB [Pyrinomonadaceae bacterium]|nr:energy transducer TonB [Pyrinomonadaceae bacterium]
MFSNLVESGSHRAESRRRGRYFLSTVALYALLLAATGVGSIYAYNVRVEDRAGYEVTALLSFAEEPAPPKSRPEQSRPARSAAPAAASPRVPTVTDLSHNNPHLQDRPVAAADVPTVSPGVGARIGNFNDIRLESADYGGPAFGPVDGGPGRDSGPVVTGPVAPPPPRATPTPAPTLKQEPKIISLPSHVISGKAIEKPAPPYPAIARQTGIEGTVAVMVVIDEAGRVVSARATGGPIMLQAAAQQAAYRARFEPTRLNGQPVKVTGVITYNFVLQR